ncbi:hypothetical protein [Candidatus Cyanaurora vandensis]|uniref:hypothetical protein n=1 Tax=Candidatus Cyanaurora vandensis TaxID=2714958 RepID=UPI00257D682F|nr:hypothetical protein [Candidatus Cyanaurora vandensis]
MRLIPWPLRFCTALYPVVFVPWDFDTWPALQKAAVLAHERVHHRQQKALGLPKFCFHYVRSKTFRWRIERSAYQREVYFLQRAGRWADPHRYAQAVSGPLYWGMIDYRTALAWFEQLR